MVENNSSNSSTTQATEASSTRTITVVSTRGEKKKKVQFDGTEWKDLKKVLEKEGYNLDNMKCVESVNRTTLEHPTAVVPNSDFNLFLMPIKSKAGADRAGLYSKIKKHIEKDGEKAKAHFSTGKAYTNRSTSELEELLESYSPGTKKKASKAKAEAISDVVESVKTAKEGDETSLLEYLDGLSDSEKLNVLIKLVVDVSHKVGMKLEVPTDAPKGKSQEELDREERERKEREEKEKKEKEEKEENDRLEAELNNLSSGFNDVRR